MLAVDDIKRVWEPILAIVAWLVAGIGAFLTFPIDLSSTSSLGQIVAGATQAFVAIGFGIFLMGVRQKSKVKQRVWFYSSIVAFALLIVFFFVYIVLQQSWTCHYANGLRLMVGEYPTAKLTNFLRTAGDRPICAAVFDFAGDTVEMFSFPNLLLRFVILTSTYVIAWLSLACIVILVGAGLSSTKVPRKRIA